MKVLKIIAIIIIVAIIAGAGICGYFTYRYFKFEPNSNLNAQTEATYLSTEEIETIISEAIANIEFDNLTPDEIIALIMDAVSEAQGPQGIQGEQGISQLIYTNQNNNGVLYLHNLGKNTLLVNAVNFNRTPIVGERFLGVFAGASTLAGRSWFGYATIETVGAVNGLGENIVTFSFNANSLVEITAQVNLSDYVSSTQFNQLQSQVDTLKNTAPLFSRAARSARSARGGYFSRRNPFFYAPPASGPCLCSASVCLLSARPRRLTRRRSIISCTRGCP